VSFNPINRMVRAPVKPMPPEEEEDEEDILGNWGEEALPVPHEPSIGHPVKSEYPIVPVN
jgi:hypothetical protein